MTWEASTCTIVAQVEDFSAGGVATMEPQWKTTHIPRKRREQEADSIATMTTLVARDDGPAWLSDRLQQIAELGSLSDYEARTGVIPPNPVSIHNAQQILGDLAKLDLCPSRISPSSDEGICISFSLGDKYADIECFNSGDIMAASSGVDLETNVWRVGNTEIRQTLRKIASFISEL